MIFTRIERNPETGIIRFFGRPNSILDLPSTKLTPQRVHIETYKYRREKENPSLAGNVSPSGMQKKVIHAFFYNDDDVHSKITTDLDRYDVIFCIDTGTKYPANEASISGTAVTELKFSRQVANRTDAKHVEMMTLPDFCRIEYDIEKNSAEQRALIFFLVTIRHDYPTKKVGIIIDFDLAKIREYNERTCPIYNDTFYLPENFELISASSDGNPQFLVNKMMKITDTHAKKILNLGEQNALRTKSILEKFYAQQSNCAVPCDHIPRRSWPLFRAKAILNELIADLERSSSPPQLAAGVIVE